MPEGTHWEWRGFGRISQRLQDAVERYPSKYGTNEWDKTKDEYLWTGPSSVNLKIRRGGQQQGLKIKRFIKKEGELELWFEDHAELFPFDQIDGITLVKIAKHVGVSFNAAPGSKPSPEEIVQLFTNAIPPAAVVAVRKERETRNATTDVQIELAKILEVTVDGKTLDIEKPLFSLAVENGKDLTNATSEVLDKERLEVGRVLTRLNTAAEHLKIMNYLDAVSDWIAKPELRF